ncbi:MAG: Rrf2 family transcriptional regulator [Lachnospiraceae bacterium]|nr:Rrf2 family transcriptional regulator [Candidatus Equihabitans merdae]
MMISTKGRYALRVMVDLAEHGGDNYISMKSVAERQGISLKYMEKILPLLVASKLVEGVHGRGGGYRLTRKPEEYPIAEILTQTEGTLAPVACLACGAEECTRMEECRTLPLWAGLNEVIGNYLNSVTLADYVKK